MDSYEEALQNKTKQELIEIIKRLNQIVDGAIDALQRQIDDADAKLAFYNSHNYEQWRNNQPKAM